MYFFSSDATILANKDLSGVNVLMRVNCWGWFCRWSETVPWFTGSRAVALWLQASMENYLFTNDTLRDTRL